MTRSHHAPIEDLLDLLQALPHPVAAFSAADGCLLAANARFCHALALPAEESAQILRDGSGGAACDQSAYRLRIIDESIVHFLSPSGIRSLFAAQVKTARLGGQACQVIVPAAQRWQHTPASGESETGQYYDLLENLNEIIYVTDTNANVAYVSPNVYRLSGYHAHEVLGKSFTHFVHPDDLEGRIGVFLKILGGGQQATEYRMITKRGEVKWVRTDARPVLRNKVVAGVQGALVDITDRKEVEAALRRSEEKYRNVVQNSKDAIFVIQDHRLKFMNPSAQTILGLARESIAGRPFMDFVHPDDREMIADRHRRRLAGEALSNSIAFRIINWAGHVKDVELNAVLITWEGKPAVLSFLRDITVQKKMEGQLRNTQRMEALGTLSGGVAHNFNNLLMGIIGHASLSMADLAPATPAYNHLERIVGLVQSGSKLTRQLLQYARDGSRETVPVDINHLVKEASETLGAARKQIQIRFNLSRQVPRIKADQGQIEQVLLNLLLNAADAMPEGGDVFIETACLKGARAEGKVTLSKSMDYVMIKVSDSGSGIPDNILDRIFEPFFTTKGVGQGTGLGLSTVYGIVKHHDGEICVESQVGRGSTFCIYLPAHSADCTGPAAASQPPAMACQGTILLVDDEAHVLHPLAALLEHSGFTVFKAINGSAALEIFEKDWARIDLVILDLVMPHMSGKDLFYRLKEVCPGVKVLISSGYGQDGQAEALIADGCSGYIQKPYNIETLSKIMMEIIAAQ